MEQMKALIEQLNKYSYEYYTLGNPSISDATYDTLCDQLVKMERETGIILSDSPTQKVGNVVLDNLEKTKHEFPLLSLGKTQDIEVFHKFINGKSGVLMFKADGLTIDNIYEDGKLVQSATRGTGEEGEVVTHNSRVFTNLPLQIAYKGRIHISGEAIITPARMKEINSTLPKEDQYKHCRNLASGSIRQLNSQICKDRGVQFIAYNTNGLGNKYKTEDLNFLTGQGFTVIPYLEIEGSESVEVLQAKIDKLKARATLSGFPIDGLVFTFNDKKYGESLGGTSHHPNHSLAFKFEDEVEITKLINVQYQVGRTGQITPVALFEPVELDGTQVSKASVHNVSILESLNLINGDTISVYKANQIIPQIRENLSAIERGLTKQGMSIHRRAYNCPCCGEPTIVIKSNMATREFCENPKCSDKVVQQLTHYCSKNAMNIFGLSEATIRTFMKHGYITGVEDLYNLEKYRNDIISLEGFGGKSCDKLLASIEKSKTTTLDRFIYALGIEGVGRTTAKNLANHFNNNFEEFLCAPYLELCSIQDIGETIADNIVNHIYYNKSLMKVLFAYLTIKTEEPKTQVVNIENPLNGKTVYPTGTFTLKKAELKTKLEELGAIVATGYKKSLDVLICGGDMSKSGKATKAKKDNENGANILIMSEEELLKLF